MTEKTLDVEKMFLLCSNWLWMNEADRMMVQKVRDFAEASRKNLGITVACECGKRAVFPARNFAGFIAPGADIGALNWRCTWCRGKAAARYILLEIVDREALAQWTPPAGIRRRF